MCSPIDFAPLVPKSASFITIGRVLRLEVLPVHGRNSCGGPVEHATPERILIVHATFLVGKSFNSVMYYHIEHSLINNNVDGS